jgi:hypothetical protein
LSTAGSRVAFFGVAYVLERGLIELWKTFLRNEDQGKYFIPMQFAVFWKVVQSQARRLVIGAIMTAAVCGTFLIVHYSAPKLPLAGAPVTVFLIATISGWISAFLGAWKDAPVEGFQPLKFVRSPLWAGFWGLLLAHFTTSILVVMMAGLGFTIFTLETYKTFFFPSKPRGKFAGKPILFPEMLRRRPGVRAALCRDLGGRLDRLLSRADRAALRPGRHSVTNPAVGFTLSLATERRRYRNAAIARGGRHADRLRDRRDRLARWPRAHWLRALRRAGASQELGAGGGGRGGGGVGGGGGECGVGAGVLGGLVGVGWWGGREVKVS